MRKPLHPLAAAVKSSSLEESLSKVNSRDQTDCLSKESRQEQQDLEQNARMRLPATVHKAQRERRCLTISATQWPRPILSEQPRRPRVTTSLGTVRVLSRHGAKSTVEPWLSHGSHDDPTRPKRAGPRPCPSWNTLRVERPLPGRDNLTHLTAVATNRACEGRDLSLSKHRWCETPKRNAADHTMLRSFRPSATSTKVL